MLATTLTTSLLGCSKEPALYKFESCEQMEAYIKDEALEWYKFDINWSLSLGAETMLATAGEDDSNADVTEAAGREYSTTNVQELGVDEADFMKNDGSYIYLLSDNDFVVIRAWPAEDLEEIGRVRLGTRPESMYIYNGVAAIFSSEWGEDPNWDGDEWEDTPMPEVPISEDALGDADNDDPFVGGEPLVGALTRLTLIDLSNPAEPSVVREVVAEGRLIQSRRIDHQIYLVLQQSLEGPPPPDDDSFWLSNQGEEKRAIRNSTLADWMPRLNDRNRRGGQLATESRDVCDCTNAYGTTTGEGPAMVSVLALDTRDPQSELVGTSVVSSSGTVYASTTALYIAVTETDDELIADGDSLRETRLHKFEIDGAPANPTYVATGEVDGTLDDQYQMDEEGDYFRVTTTERNDTTWEASSNLFVLEQQEDRLEVIGEVRGIAPGEEIYATRFIGDVAYVVTFRQTDPLFTIDLSNPAAPKVMGELEVTGYSSYLHPLEDDYLIGIGEEIGEDGWSSEGMQISVYDVSDLSDPKMTDREVLDTGYAWSEAITDPHAFNYFVPLETLAVPVVIYDTGYSGLYLYRITGEDGIAYSGELNLDAAAEGGHEEEYEEYFEYYGSGCAQVRRSVFIEDRVYAVSEAGVVTAAMDDLENVLGSVWLGGECDSGDYY